MNGLEAVAEFFVFFRYSTGSRLLSTDRAAQELRRALEAAGIPRIEMRAREIQSAKSEQ